MEINLKKSEVIVVRARSWRCLREKRRQATAGEGAGTRETCHDNFCPPESGCVLCSPWVCRGQRLKVVRKYKYLGIWFTSNLRWDTHIASMLAKARARTKSLYITLGNSRLPARAKTLIWLSSVRPLLEYGCEVWTANTSDVRRLEASQLAAGKRIFRLNARTNSEAVRALMHAPDLQTRYAKARLKYVAKLMAMEKGRLARSVIMEMKPQPAEQYLGRTKHWWTRMSDFIAADPVLATAFAKLNRSAARNQGVVPTGIDPTIHDYEYAPVDAWRKSVERWAKSTTLSTFMGRRQGSTLDLLRRGVIKDGDRLPSFPLTRKANRGANQTRLRLLAGTSALNGTMHKYRQGKSAGCPFASCDGPTENPIHFLLHCKGLEGPRKEYLARLTDRCTCDRRLGSGGVQGCDEFFGALDDAGKALFMLGGPVDGRVPETEVDACAHEYVRCAYGERSRILELERTTPTVGDSTSGSGLLKYFPLIHAPHHAGSKKPGTARTRHASIAQSTTGETLGTRCRRTGSGLYDAKNVMRSD